MTTASTPSGNPNDDSFMRIALDLAKRGEGRVEPNPMVGCVIVRDGQLIGQGYHRIFGGPHAEIEALRSLQSLADAKGATAYVTLEPCCHQGKTPPCSQSLIDAGVSRVVVAVPDPFPQVDGDGLRQLSEAGIEVSVGTLRTDAEYLCAPYLKKVRTGIPWVIAKWAMTMDGKIATLTGKSQWITGDASRRNVHRLRSRVDAIIVGMGTVTADDPMLTARLETGVAPRIATRVVFCRQHTPKIDSQLVQSAPDVPLLLITGPTIDPQQIAELQSLDAEVVALETDDPIKMITLGLEQLGSRDMTNVMLEGGGALIGSFFDAGQIDECHVYIGGKSFGGHAALGPIGGAGVRQIGDAWQGNLQSVSQFDNDVFAVYRRI